MCGIAGILEHRRHTPERFLLEAMARRLRHRGPDGHGIHVDGPCGLVHTRLAILDPERGKQPLSNARGDLWITYNGEIYNSPDLRRRLEGQGHAFRTTTDTEVIVALYQAKPDSFVEELEGIFAFALWDAARRRLVLARDYLGVKPLYIYEGPQALVFGSEIKALLVDPRVPCAPDEQGVMEILAFQNTYGSRTCFQDIRLLEGGETLVISLDGARRRRRFWSFAAALENAQAAGPSSPGQVRDTCTQVIQDQLLSDVPLATFLSGGMDTGIITAVTRPRLDRLHTFSGGFYLEGAPPEFHAFDERDAARLMSDRYLTDHHFEEIHPDTLWDVFPKIAWHLEEPRGSTCYAPWTMAQAVSRHVKVVLSGHGGDELFAGYKGRYQVAQGMGERWENEWFGALNYLVPVGKGECWLHPRWARQDLLAWPRQVYQEFVGPSRGLSALARAQHHDLFVYMHGLLLIEDKISMAHSLESRVPFLDRRVFQTAWSLPDERKLGPDRGKVILREAFQGVLPEAILQRDKMGFGPPEEHYYRQQLRPLFQQLLLGPSFQQRGLMRPDVVRDVLERQLRGEAWSGLMWTLASLELWHRAFFDRVSHLRAREGDDHVGPVHLTKDSGFRLDASSALPGPRQSRWNWRRPFTALKKAWSCLVGR